MYEMPTLLGGGWCFIIAWMNAMLLLSLHILSVPMIRQVNPLVPLRRVRMAPSLPTRTTAASLAIAAGAAESASVMYFASETWACCAKAAKVKAIRKRRDRNITTSASVCSDVEPMGLHAARETLHSTGLSVMRMIWRDFARRTNQQRPAPLRVPRATPQRDIAARV